MTNKKHTLPTDLTTDRVHNLEDSRQYENGEQHFINCNAKVQNKARYIKTFAVKELERLVFEKKQIKHPSIPIELLSRETFRDDTANKLTACIIKFIQLKGGQAERISTTGRVIDRSKIVTDTIGIMKRIGTAEYIPGTTTNGSADISSIIKGFTVKIEVKIGKDRQSPAQIKYQEAVESAGGLYFIAKDFTSFLEWFNSLFEGF
ncbi:MAG: hypothetical protein WCG93_13190 [Paludibacter sp.]